eukprot:TRINITY_DN61554_c0_g2_i3.p2 TRINITY_DN61554_c0_g2~~TRINITY_DN61554_c0_g2_i3.p2  ORF type:complete len:124 (-),score=0.68 TRINITY_DN61554_c0_g2_i3:70-441(-)
MLSQISSRRRDQSINYFFILFSCVFKKFQHFFTTKAQPDFLPISRVGFKGGINKTLITLLYQVIFYILAFTFFLFQFRIVCKGFLLYCMTLFLGVRKLDRIGENCVVCIGCTLGLKFFLEAYH